MDGAAPAFLENSDLSGKQVYLFCSHGTGGLANSVDIITEALPGAEISDNKQFFCFTGKIQRDIGDRAVLAISALGKADGVFRMAVGDVALKGRCGLILAALCLDGDDFCAIL